MGKKIVLVVGAGASNDLHPEFALSGELLQQISDRVTDRTSVHNKHVSKLLSKVGFKYHECWNFVHHLDEYKNSAQSPSIDEFLNEVTTYPEYSGFRESFLNIGKASILIHILGYEAQLNGRDGITSREDSWINLLCQSIHKKRLLDTNEEYDLKIVTFNYDRNIEHFIYNYREFANRKQDVSNFIKKSIVHIYGKVGELPWQNSENSLNFGESHDNIDKIVKSKDSIKIMFPDRQKNENAEIAISWIHPEETSSTVYALGFGFDFLNYKILGLNNQFIRSDDTKLKLVANIYPFENDGFKSRREMAKKIRSIQEDVELTYLSCRDFIGKIFK